MILGLTIEIEALYCNIFFFHVIGTGFFYQINMIQYLLSLTCLQQKGSKHKILNYLLLFFFAMQS